MSKRKFDQTQAQRREFQKNLSVLKAKGLVSSKVDVRTQKPTRHMKAQIRKFEGVISGRDAVVKVPRGKAKDFDGKFDRKGNAVVVPKPQLGGTARYSKKAGDIVSSAKIPGGKIVSEYRRYSLDELRKLEGPNVSFSVAVPRGTYNEVWRKRTVAELASLFEDGSFRNFSGWARYVNVERYTGDLGDTELPTAIRRERGRRR